MRERRISVRRRRAATTVAAAALMILAPPALGQSPRIGDPPEAKNMRVVGYSDLHARSAYQPTIHHQGGRYIAYVGHHGQSPTIRNPTIASPAQPQTQTTQPSVKTH